MVDRTASLRWKETGLPCTLMPQYSRSLPRAVSASGTKPACYPHPQPHSSTSSLWDTFLGLEKLLVRFIATSGSGTKALHQLQTQAPLCLPELLMALGDRCHPIIFLEFGVDSQSIPGYTSSRCLLGSLEACGPDPHPSLSWIPVPSVKNLLLLIHLSVSETVNSQVLPGNEQACCREEKGRRNQP